MKPAKAQVLMQCCAMFVAWAKVSQVSWATGTDRTPLPQEAWGRLRWRCKVLICHVPRSMSWATGLPQEAAPLERGLCSITLQINTHQPNNQASTPSTSTPSPTLTSTTLKKQNK